MRLAATILARAGARAALGEPDGAPVVDLAPGASYSSVAGSVAGDVVVLVDAGLVLPTGWLDGLLRAFDDPNVAMVGPVFNDGEPGPAQ